MHPADIKAALWKRGIKQKQIADEVGVTQMSVSEVINKRRVSDRVMKAVARAIDKDHRIVFDWYYLKPPKRSTSKVSTI